MGIGRRTGKKLLSGVLSLAMMVGMVSGVSFNTFADESYPLFIRGVQVNDSNCNNPANDWEYDNTTRTLTLKTFQGGGGQDATIKYTEEDEKKGLTIVLDGKSQIDNNSVPIIYSEKVWVEIKAADEGTCSLSIETTADNAIAVGNNQTLSICGGVSVSAKASTAAIAAGAISVSDGASLIAEGTGSSGYGISITDDTSYGVVSINSTADVVISGKAAAFSGGKVKNYSAGMGWTSQDRLAIPVADDPQDLSVYQKIQFPAAIVDTIDLSVTVPDVASTISSSTSPVTTEGTDAYSITAKYVNGFDDDNFQNGSEKVYPNGDVFYKVTVETKDGYYFKDVEDLTINVNGEAITFDDTNYKLNSDDENKIVFYGKLQAGDPLEQTITTEENIALKVGDTQKITASALDNANLSIALGENGNLLTLNSADWKITGKYAGTAKVVITAEATYFYAGATKTINVTVSKYEQNIIAEDTMTLTIGDEQDIGATLDPADGGALTYSVKSGDAVTVDSTGKVTAVKAGTATIEIKAAETDTYAAATKEITVTVNKGNSSVKTAPVEKTGLIANGSDQALVTAGEAENGTMQYAIGDNATTAPSSGWSDKIPTAKDSGTYYVWYKSFGGDNYNDSEAACVKVVIAAPTATPTPTATATPVPTKEPTKAPAKPTVTSTPEPTKEPAKPTVTSTPEPTATPKPAKNSLKRAEVKFQYSEYEYKGGTDPIKPAISVTIDGTKLKGKTDFTGELKNNDRPGTASITLTAVKGGKYIDSVTYDFNIVAVVNCGKTLDLSQIKAWKGATFAISNKTIASVDKSGKVTGKQAGTATVTVTTKDKKTETFNLRVLYKDVTNISDFWYEPTNALTATGIVKGYDKQTNFKPGNECSRAQMVTFLWRLAGEPEPSAKTTSFKDIKTKDYFYKPVLWAVEKGITTGVSKTKFDPQGICTRAQTVTFLWRMAGKPEPKAKTSKFKDVKSKDYFYKATIWASEKSIVAGYSDGTFKPQGKCLRRQMVTFLYKYSNNVGVK